MDSTHILAPLSFALLLLAFWVAALVIPGAWLFAGILVALLSPIGAVLAVVAGAVALVILFWRRHWTSGVTMILALVTLVLLATQPTIADSPARWIADLTRVMYYRSALLRQAHELTREGVSPALACIDIDGFGSLTSGIALDPTGEIALPPNKRSRAWNATAARSELSVEGLRARHIVGHYYMWFHD